MGFKTYVQDPADILRYPFNFQSPDVPAENRFLQAGMEIVSASFGGYTGAGVPIVFTPSDDVVLSDEEHDETTAQVVVAFEDPASAEYYVTVHVVASDGQEKDWTIKIKIKEQ